MVQKIYGGIFNQNTRFTRRGNQYQKTNVGKLAGVGVGAVAGIAQAVQTFKAAKEIDVKSLKGSILPSIQNLSAQFPNIPKENIDEASKVLSNTFDSLPKYVKTAAVVVAGLLALTGLAVGSIGDGIANKIKAFNADKNAKSQHI
jgi:hypothetical protein